jgi:hypothetical protein
MRYLPVSLLLALAGPATARDYRAEARAAIALSLALQATPVPATPTPAKSCPCSPECTCGCNEGQPCRCGSPTVITGASIQPAPVAVPYFSRPAYAPSFAPVQPFRQSFAPSFRGSGACRSG